MTHCLLLILLLLHVQMPCVVVAANVVLPSAVGRVDLAGVVVEEAVVLSGEVLAYVAARRVCHLPPFGIAVDVSSPLSSSSVAL